MPSLIKMTMSSAYADRLRLTESYFDKEVQAWLGDALVWVDVYDLAEALDW